MSNLLKAILTIVLSIVGSTAAFLVYTDLLFSALPLPPLPLNMALAAGALCGLLYGLESGFLLSYRLDRTSGWLLLLCDLSWSYPNTIFGLILGNLFYPFFGSLSRELSEGKNWIAYAKEREGTRQTLGVVNLGGEGLHERIHVFQARLLGPFFLPIFLLSYVATAGIQMLWSITIGPALYLTGHRRSIYLRPPASFSPQGFFGWICYATPLELWAIARQSPKYASEARVSVSPL